MKEFNKTYCDHKYINRVRVIEEHKKINVTNNPMITDWRYQVYRDVVVKREKHELFCEKCGNVIDG